MRVGYYVARLGRFGDPEMSGASLLAWRSLHRRAGSRYDGVTVYERDGVTTVLVTRDRVATALRGGISGGP